jgi:hypothetical protein
LQQFSASAAITVRRLAAKCSIDDKDASAPSPMEIEIMSSFFTTLIAGAALVAASGAIAQPVERTLPDTDGNGVLTRAEADAYAARQFARVDANGDGRITPEDRAAGRERRREAMFSRMDADNNGSITRAEWDSAGAAMDQRREARRSEGGDRRGAAGRPTVAEGQVRGRSGRRGQMSRTLLANADANRDGAIDRTEFLAAATTRFDRLDANRDGSVTADERRAARPARGNVQ